MWSRGNDADDHGSGIEGLRNPNDNVLGRGRGIQPLGAMPFVASKVSETENEKLLGRCLGIQPLGATSFDNLLTSIEVVVAFILQTGECIGLLGVALEDMTLDSQVIQTQGLDATSGEQQLSLGQKSPSAETLECLLMARGDPKEVTAWWGLAPVWANR